MMPSSNCTAKGLDERENVSAQKKKFTDSCKKRGRERLGPRCTDGGVGTILGTGELLRR